METSAANSIQPIHIRNHKYANKQEQGYETKQKAYKIILQSKQRRADIMITHNH
jgi:hypothetical protein